MRVLLLALCLTACAEPIGASGASLGGFTSPGGDSSLIIPMGDGGTVVKQDDAGCTPVTLIVRCEGRSYCPQIVPCGPSVTPR